MRAARAVEGRCAARHRCSAVQSIIAGGRAAPAGASWSGCDFPMRSDSRCAVLVVRCCLCAMTYILNSFFVSSMLATPASKSSRVTGVCRKVHSCDEDSFLLFHIVFHRYEIKLGILHSSDEAAKISRFNALVEWSNMRPALKCDRSFPGFLRQRMAIVTKKRKSFYPLPNS